MKIQVKLETPDRLKTVNDESNLKMNLASQGGVSDSRKESSIDQVSYWVMLKLLAMQKLNEAEINVTFNFAG